jgi:hypothetical protein
MKRLFIAAAIALAGFTLGCGDDRTVSPPPMAPSPVPLAPVPAPAVVPQTLYGYVGDTAFRPVAGARIEVLNGPQVGTVMTSDDQGRFSYTGTFTPPVNLRATKDGFAVATLTVILGTDRPYAFFNLTPLVPPVAAAGNYTLTISADSACTGIPQAARTRSYAATVTLNTRATPLNTRFDGTVTGGVFPPYANLFWVGVAGDYVAVSTEGEGPSIVEQLDPLTYVAYYGSAGASIGTPSVSTLSAPFTGVIEYCELKAPIGQYYDCSPELAAAREQCTLPNSRLTLTRR